MPTPSPAQFETVTFAPFPEVPVSALAWVLEYAKLNYRLRQNGYHVPSYGGFVLRNAVGLVPHDIISQIATSGVPHKAPFSTNSMGLHRDEHESARLADVTAHQTVDKEVDAIVLPGATINITDTTSSLSKTATRRLLREGRVSRTRPLVSNVGVALRATLTEYDMLLFDHTQPHAFYGPRGRESRAAY